MSETTESPAPEKKKGKGQYLIIGLIVAAVAAVIFSRMNKSEPVKIAAVAGIINFNGLKPKEEPNKAVSIKLMAKGPEDQNFIDTGVSIPVADLATWQWAQASEGVTYIFRADGYYGSEMIASSSLVTATAPATGQVLTFNITSADLPAGLKPEVEVDTTVSVSGSVVLNGFIPQGSTVTIFGRPKGSTAEFKAAVTRLPAVSGTNWSFDQAKAGASYEYQAEMYNASGTFIGQSPYITVTAPAANEIVTINSTAVAPTQTATLKGRVTLQGPVTQNSTVLVLQRKAGSADYAVIERYPAKATVDWSWAGAAAGSSYDVTAALQVNEANTATGNVQTVTAPAENVNITINTGVNLPAPTQTVSVTCGDPDGTNHFNARVSLPQMPQAKTYYLEVGTAAGSNNVFAKTVAPNSDATVFIAGASPHFARYTYSSCTDCDIESNSNWAGWSPTLGFTCPANTPTPTPTPTAE